MPWCCGGGIRFFHQGVIKIQPGAVCPEQFTDHPGDPRVVNETANDWIVAPQVTSSEEPIRGCARVAVGNPIAGLAQLALRNFKQLVDPGGVDGLFDLHDTVGRKGLVVRCSERLWGQDGHGVLFDVVSEYIKSLPQNVIGVNIIRYGEAR